MNKRPRVGDMFDDSNKIIGVYEWPKWYDLTLYNIIDNCNGNVRVKKKVNENE